MRATESMRVNWLCYASRLVAAEVAERRGQGWGQIPAPVDRYQDPIYTAHGRRRPQTFRAGL